MKVKCALIQLAFRKGVDNALTAAEGFIAEAAADGAESVAEASEEVSEPDMSAVSALISSARTLLDADYESNRGAIASLIENAAAQLGGNRPEVKALLDSVKTLMDSEDGAAEPIGALLDEIAAKLGQQ